MRIHERLRQPLGLWSLTALVAGNMIGSGVFLLPANLSLIGTISLLSWLITGSGSLLLAYLFMKLSQAHPKVGGPYAYVHNSAGNFLGFQTAYCYWLAIWIGNAAIALASVAYASLFWPILSSPQIATGLAIAIIWLLTLTNCFGIYLSGIIASMTTVLKILPLLLIGLLGWFWVHGHYYVDYWNITTPSQSPIKALSLSAALTLWAFIGLESATIPADQVKNPQKNIPRATLLGSLIALIIYVLSSVVIFGIIPATSLQHISFPFAVAAQMILGPLASDIVAMAAIIACLGCLNGWILLQGQIPLSAATDGVFPRIFAKRNTYNMPAWGMIISSLLITILLLLTLSQQLVKQFEEIILLAVFTTLIPYFYTATASCLFKKILLPDTKSRWFNAMAILIMVYTGWMILSTGEHVLAIGACVLLSSIPVYLFIKKYQSNRSPH